MSFAIPDLATAFMLTFARVGTLVMLMPGIGEQLISPRARLAFALAPFARAVSPDARAPAAGRRAGLGDPRSSSARSRSGSSSGSRCGWSSALCRRQGPSIAQQLGLAFAMSVDPAMGGQQASIGNLLTLLGIALIFAADLHHLAIAAIRDSYTLLPPAGFPSTGDAASLAIRAAARGFALAVQISAPFIAFAILFNLGLGVLSRLMPQLQVFFLGLPATILIGMLVLLRRPRRHDGRFRRRPRRVPPLLPATVSHGRYARGGRPHRRADPKKARRRDQARRRAEEHGDQYALRARRLHARLDDPLRPGQPRPCARSARLLDERPYGSAGRRRLCRRRSACPPCRARRDRAACGDDCRCGSHRRRRPAPSALHERTAAAAILPALADEGLQAPFRTGGPGPVREGPPEDRHRRDDRHDGALWRAGPVRGTGECSSRRRCCRRFLPSASS